MKKIKIMIVDDHQLVLDGLRSYLKEIQKFDIVAEANNGKQALEKAKLAHPDVVLMDIDMPVMNGIEATKQLVRDYPEIKILALSMHNEKAMINKMGDAGAKGYMLKNANKSELLDAIAKLVAGQNYFSSEITIALLEQESKEIRSSPSTGTNILLTEREIEIMKLIAAGLSNKEVGEKLFISHRTVDTHRTNLMEKLNVKNVAGLIRYAIQNGYID